MSDDCRGLGPYSPPKGKWCDICGQLEAQYFTEIYDPMIAELRTYWLCCGCQAQLSERIRSIIDRGVVA